MGSRPGRICVVGIVKRGTFRPTAVKFGKRSCEGREMVFQSDDELIKRLGIPMFSSMQSTEYHSESCDDQNCMQK